MFFKHLFGKFKSPEGPFSWSPKWLKGYLPNIANVLGVGIYILEEKHRSHIGRYVALQKEESLFLFYRISEEVKVLCPKGESRLDLTAYVIHRLFGADGGDAILEALYEYAQDKNAVGIAQVRGHALAKAALGDISFLVVLPEYQNGILGGREFAALSPDTKFAEDFELAFWGLHYIWFSKLFMTEQFKKFIDTMVAGDAAATALGIIYKMMRPK